MKKLLVFAAVLAFFAFGCSGRPDRESAAGEVVTVRFWHAMGGPLGEILDSLIDEFNASHPGVRIRSESMGTYEALRQRLLASVIAGNQPEMAQAYESWIATLIGGEALVDLGELDPGFVAELEDFFPVFIENSYYGGRLMSLPFNKSVPIIYYNRDMFRRAGLDAENPPRTWDEFIETARVLTRDLDGSGTPDQWGHKFSDHATYFECLLVQNGGEIFDSETNQAIFDSPEGVEALQFLVDLVHRYRVADFYLGGYDHQVDFSAGRVGMIVASCVSRTFMRHQIKFDWGMAPLLENRQPAALVYGTNIVILSRARPEQRQAAWEFIKWFTSPEITARWALATGYVPVRRSAQELPVMRAEFERNPDSRVPIDMLEHAFFEPRWPEWLRARDFLSDGVKEALLGKSSPEQALRRAAEKGNFWLR